MKFNYKREGADYCSNGYFDTISTAYNGCYGSTITVLNDVTESSAYTFKNYGVNFLGKGIYIELNGHTLTIPSLIFDSSDGEAVITGPGKITYNSSSFSDTYLLNIKNGVLSIDGGTYNSNNMTGVINLESTGDINLADSKARLAIESNSSTLCSRGINSLSSDEIVIQSKTNGINIYGSCYGIDHAGVLRLYSYYPSGNNKGVEMAVIGNYGYAALKRTGNIQVGSPVCATRDSCTAAEIEEGSLGHYGYGTEMYPYLASYSATTNNNELFEVVYNNSDVVVYFTGGRLVSTKTGLSCANGGIYSSSDACNQYFSKFPIRAGGSYTGIKYSTVSNETNSHGDNISGFKAMLYK